MSDWKFPRLMFDAVGGGTYFFCPEVWYTLHIDAPEGGTEMETEKVYAMPFAKI